VKTRYLTITKYGEKISFQLNPNYGEDTRVTFGLNQHSVCGGVVDVQPVSLSHYVLVCGRCKLRVVIPNEINTYRKLKKYVKVLRR